MKEQLVLVFEKTKVPKERKSQQNINSYILEELIRLSEDTENLPYQIIQPESEEEKALGLGLEFILEFCIENPDTCLNFLIAVSLKIKEFFDKKKIAKIKLGDKKLPLPAKENEIKKFLK